MFNKLVKGFCPLMKTETTIAATIVPNPTFDNPNCFEIGTITCNYGEISNCSFLKQDKCPIKASIKQ